MICQVLHEKIDTFTLKKNILLIFQSHKVQIIMKLDANHSRWARNLPWRKRERDSDSSYSLDPLPPTHLSPLSVQHTTSSNEGSFEYTKS